MCSQKSFRGRRWYVASAADADVRALRARGASAPVASILATRGVTAEGYDKFLEPKIRHMDDPFEFNDMEKAVLRVTAAIRDSEKIGIWSDYDVDGATSAGVLGWFLRMCGHDDFMIRIPDRITEGYGPNTPGLLAMKEAGCGLICILDSGTLAFEPLAAAKAAGIDVVVIDHHAAEEAIPEAVAVVNPNRKDQKPGYGHLCAAGVTFVFTVAAARKLRDDGFFRGPVPDLMRLLDLVALGTVCDVVPLVGLNRAFVRRGLPYLTQRQRPGIAALCAAAGIADNAAITAGDCGWVLGPRINAGGRIGESGSGAALLLEQDPDEARRLAEELNRLNVERQELEAACTRSAMADIGGREDGDRTLALAVTDAHEGVVGISASRVKDAHDAPAIVLTRTHDGLLKGSARSVEGFDIGHAIIAARQAGLIIKGGGHGMAGGLTLSQDQLPDFISFMNAEIARTVYWREGVVSAADTEIRLRDLTVAMIDEFDGMAPFGTGNPEPRVILARVELAELRVLKDKHFKMVFRDRGCEIDGLIWNVAGTPLGRRMEAARGTLVDVLCKAEINVFRGNRRPQIMIQDMRPSGSALV